MQKNILGDIKERIGKITFNRSKVFKADNGQLVHELNEAVQALLADMKVATLISHHGRQGELRLPRQQAVDLRGQLSPHPAGHRLREDVVGQPCPAAGLRPKAWPPFFRRESRFFSRGDEPGRSIRRRPKGQPNHGPTFFANNTINWALILI